MTSFRALTRTARLARPTLPARAAITTSAPRLTQTGYGDPQDEKIANETPLPGSGGSGSADTSPSTGKDKVGSNPSGGATNKGPDGTTVKETKKIGEAPKKEEVGEAGPIGGQAHTTCINLSGQDETDLKKEVKRQRNGRTKQEESIKQAQ